MDNLLSILAVVVLVFVLVYLLCGHYVDKKIDPIFGRLLSLFSRKKDNKTHRFVIKDSEYFAIEVVFPKCTKELHDTIALVRGHTVTVVLSDKYKFVSVPQCCWNGERLSDTKYRFTVYFSKRKGPERGKIISQHLDLTDFFSARKDGLAQNIRMGVIPNYGIVSFKTAKIRDGDMGDTPYAYYEEAE